MTLARLLTHLSRDGFESTVVSLTTAGPVAGSLRQAGFDVVALGLSRARFATAAWRLGARLREFRPNLVQTWLYHADLLGGAVARLSVSCPVLWNLRTATPVPLSFSTRAVATMCAKASHLLPTRIVCCSEAAAREHARYGYDSTRMVVIHNGFDTARLGPDLDARADLRSELGIPMQAKVVGYVARFDSLKDHATFVAAAGLLARTLPEVFFVLCGDDTTWENSTLASWIDRANVRDRFRLLGRRSDVKRVNALFDIATCCSLTEGLPNVVGEAMACGVPCVVTDTGDSALLVGDTGRVVPTADPSALAAAWAEMLRMDGAALAAMGTRSRQRIESEFDLSKMGQKYAALYRRVSGE